MGRFLALLIFLLIATSALVGCQEKARHVRRWDADDDPYRDPRIRRTEPMDQRPVELRKASQMIAVSNHPRLVLGADDIPALRDRAGREPYASMVKAIRKAIAADPPYWTETNSKAAYDFDARDLATLYLVTGDSRYAQQSADICVRLTTEEETWQNPKANALSRAAEVMTVALAYDNCSDAWNPETRQLISRRLLVGARLLMESMDELPRERIANNWEAVCYSAAGCALLACDERSAGRVATECYEAVVNHLRANLGKKGWNPEGIGYVTYPWAFTGPFGIAAQRAGIGDLRTDVPQARLSLWTTFVGTVAIPRVDGVGIHPDLVDDNPIYSGNGSAGLAFYYSAPEQMPAIKWMYDYLLGSRGDKSYDTEWGGGLYSLLLYPADLPPQNPADSFGLNFVDDSAGVSVFRNAFKDENDIVVETNAKARQPRETHAGADTNTFRILGLGGCFVTGSGRTANAQGQTNLFSWAPPTDPDVFKTGKLLARDFTPDGGGFSITTGSCVGVSNHRRLFAVDYSGKSGAPAVFVDSETSDGGRIWRLNTPEFNRITTSRNRFTITSPNGAMLVGTVITPKDVDEFRTGTFLRGGEAAHAEGFPYRGKHYANNKWLEFDCHDDVLVIMTLQTGDPPRVSGSGTPNEANINVGSVQVHVAPDRVSIQ